VDCDLSRRVCGEPNLIVLPDLVDVMRNVALLALNPFFEADLTLFGVLHSVQPDGFREFCDQSVGHSAQASNDFERFAGALVEVAKRTGPLLGIEFRKRYAWFRNQMPAAHVGAGLAISQVNNDLVNTPAVRGRFVKPHLFR